MDSILQFYNEKTHELIMPDCFNEYIAHKKCNNFNCPHNLPNPISYLAFVSKFNQIIDNLPNEITHLTLGYHFNQPVNNLPNSITHLTFGSCFNQPVDNLPNSITHLIFGEKFNQPIDNLPNSITHLTLKWCFNQAINKYPDSLIEFEYWSYSNINNLPYIKSLIIVFGHKDNKEITNIPITVEKIKINDFTRIYLLKNIPFECEIMDIHNTILN